VTQRPRGAELVNRSAADSKILGRLTHRQQLLQRHRCVRGHRGDKPALVRRGIGSIRRICWLSALNDFELLLSGATRYYARRSPGVELASSMVRSKSRRSMSQAISRSRNCCNVP
jgi:hypothetical protein